MKKRALHTKGLGLAILNINALGDEGRNQVGVGRITAATIFIDGTNMSFNSFELISELG
jgi:hypothetical protein